LVVTIILPGLLGGCLDEVFGPPPVERTEWAFEMVQATDMSDRGLKGNGVTVAVIDSGIDVDHPALSHHAESLLWKDFVNGRTKPYDDNGHGTHVAGIVAGSGPLKGVAPKATLIVVKVIGADGSGTDGAVADGIDYAVTNGADVITLSLGGGTSFWFIGDDTAQAVQDAIDAGVFVVAAAGNDGRDDDGDVASPGYVPGCITVGAVDQDGSIAEFSSRGNNGWGAKPTPLQLRQDPDKKPEVVAPGVGILSAWPGDGYARANGTSQATPFVSGVITLVLEQRQDLRRSGSEGGSTSSIDTVKDAIMRTAALPVDCQAPHDDRCGYGIVKGDDLLKRLSSSA